ncbi:MAG: hypothetical protein ACE5I4_00725 [Thermoplasmata archaeon]
MVKWPARETVLPWLRMAILLAVFGALIEFVLLRLLLRGGAFAPPGAILDQLFSLMLTLGLAALNFAFLTTGIALALVAFILFRRGILERTAALLIVALLAVGLLLPLLSHPTTPLLYQGLLLVLLLPLLLLFPRRRSWDFLAACAIAGALGTTYYFQAGLSGAAIGLQLPYVSEIFSGGEVLAVAAPLLLLPGRGWRPSLVPVAALAAVIFVFVSASAFVSLAAVWTVYFTLFLPMPVYAVALGAATYSLAAFLSDKSTRWMGAGFLLILVAGRMFQSTYLAQISLLGFILFVVAASTLVLGTRDEAPLRDSPTASRLKKGQPRVDA